MGAQVEFKLLSVNKILDTGLVGKRKQAEKQTDCNKISWSIFWRITCRRFPK
jgi:hypothetical protein